MTTPLAPAECADSSEPSDFEAQAIHTVVALSEGLGRTICIARALVENGRTIDLTGLDNGVGLLCAKALDLPAEAGRTVRHHLLGVLAEVDALTAALQTYGKP